MTTPRDIRLTPRQLAIKLATRLAVEAAGGEAFAGRELGRAQSRISDYCSDTTADFIPAHLIGPLEQLGAGKPGHPHITRALAREHGGMLGHLGIEPERGRECLGDWLAAIAGETADVVRELAGNDLAASIAKLSPHARRTIVREAHELMGELEQLLTAVAGISLGPIEAEGAGPAADTS